jgi:DNA-binding transcriptional ArsR family regulator
MKHMSSALLRAVAPPRRQAILQLVWDRERTAGDIAAALPEVTFSAVSQHLRILRDAGVVVQRREGKHRLYRVQPAALGPLATFFETQWRTDLDRLKALAEAEEARHG